jgi:hypothetical protein
MPTERLSMRRIREVVRLRHQGLTERVIARTLGVSNGVVHGYWWHYPKLILWQHKIPSIGPTFEQKRSY